MSATNDKPGTGMSGSSTGMISHTGWRRDVDPLNLGASTAGSLQGSGGCNILLNSPLLSGKSMLMLDPAGRPYRAAGKRGKRRKTTALLS